MTHSNTGEPTMTMQQLVGETTPALNVQGPITRDAVAIRLDPLNWPEDLKRDDIAGPSAMARAIDEARETFSEFEAVRETEVSSSSTPWLRRRRRPSLASDRDSTL